VRVEYVEPVTRIRDLARTYWFEVPVVLLTIDGMVEVVVRRGAPDAPHTSLWFALPALAVLVLPLFARRRFPFAAPLMFWLLAAVITFVDGQLLAFATSTFVLGMGVAFLVGNLREAAEARVGLLVVLLAEVIIVYNIPGHPASQLFFIPILFGICWVAGFAVRDRVEQAEAAHERADQAEEERDAAKRIAVAEERARIARELHDIVAHAVSVMVLQVGAVRHKLPDTRAEDRDALRRVEQAGRAALAEMRRLLAVMRRDGEDVELMPQPGLGGLDSLVNEIGRAGLPVQLHIDGKPFPLPQGIDLSAYRIAQEGLTNALKHASASHAELTVRYAPDEIRIDVCDDGYGAAATDEQGHGLIGIHERVKLYGGEMTAATVNGGGFVLSTRLPLTPDRQ
jgi:signal transduction histidine kinase